MMLNLKKYCLVVMPLLLALSGCVFLGPERGPEPNASVLEWVMADVSEEPYVRVEYSYIRGPEPEAVVTCTYPGGTRVLRDTEPNDSGYEKGGTFEITVETPGTYQVTCTLGGVTKSAEFTIKHAATASPSASTSARIEDFKTGVLALVLDSTTSSVKGFQPLFSCLPGQKYPNGNSTFALAADGTFSGSCVNTETRRADYAIVHSSQFVDGKLSRDGEVMFTLSVKMVTQTPTTVRVLDGTFKASGRISEGDIAKGKSDWTVDCRFDKNEDRSVCPNGEATPSRITGTVDWIIQFHP